MKAEPRDQHGHQGAGELVSPETVAMCNRSRNRERMRTTNVTDCAKVVPCTGAAHGGTGVGETRGIDGREASDQVNPMTETTAEEREEKGLRPMATEDEKEEEKGAEEEGEEGRDAVAMPSPMSPSRQEREQHELTHTPYRAWCPHCVRARGRNRAHKTNKDPEKSTVPKISFD